jgi:hypothetical protein
MVKKRVAPIVLLACSMMLAACDTTPPPVSALMQQLTAVSQSHDKEALRACYAKEGVTADQIDQEVGGWEEYFDPGEHWNYTGIKYVSMADAPNNKDIMPDWITSAQGETMSGIRFAPNLKVIGFILISYKQPTGEQAGETLDVGIASDGSAKIVSIEPQH